MEFNISKIETNNIKLDKQNLFILQKLNENSRCSLQELSSKLNLSKPAVSNRIEQLKKEKILLNPMIVINFNNLDYTAWSIYLKTTIHYENKDFYKKLNLENIVEVIGLYGEYSIYIKFITKTEAEKDKIITNIIKTLEVKDYQYYKVNSYDIIPAKKYIDEKKLNILTPYKLNITKLDLDILKLIANNPEISNIEISKKLQVSFQKISYHIKNLFVSRTILLSCYFSNIFLFNMLSYMIMFDLKDKEIKNSFSNFLLSYNNTNGVSIFEGKEDIMCIFISKSLFDFHEFFDIISKKYPGKINKFNISLIQTQFYMNHFPTCIKI